MEAGVKALFGAHCCFLRSLEMILRCTYAASIKTLRNTNYLCVFFVDLHQSFPLFKVKPSSMSQVFSLCFGWSTHSFAGKQRWGATSARWPDGRYFPKKLTSNLKNRTLEREIPNLETTIFRFHVSFRGCTSWPLTCFAVSRWRLKLL